MDIVLQIIINPATHDLSYDPVKEAARYVFGDVIGVHLATDIGTLSGLNYAPNDIVSSPRCAFIFIRGAPDGPLQDVKNKFTESKTDNIDPEKTITLLKSNWSVNSLPTPAKTVLVANKYITFLWTPFKNYMRNKSENRFVDDTDI